MSYRSQVCLAVPLPSYVALLRLLKVAKRLDVVSLLRGYNKKTFAFAISRATTRRIVQASDGTPWVLVAWDGVRWDEYEPSVKFLKQWLFIQTEFQFSRAGEDVDDREDIHEGLCEPLFMTWADSGIDIF